MQRVYIVYPPSFSPSHVNYLKYMLRSIGDYDFITQNRMLLQIASFCPVPDASSIPMILFDACYDALHIFVCELSLTRVKVLQHVWSVSLGRHCIVVRLMNSIVDQYHRKLNSALPETVLDQVYDCCNNVLDRLAIQSSCSLSVRCTGGSFSTAVHRSEVIQLLGEAIDLFKSDFESVLRAAALPAEAIRAAVLSGPCYDVPGYEETVRAVLPTAPLVRSNDVGEMMMHGLDGGLALEVAEVEETEMVMNTLQALLFSPLEYTNLIPFLFDCILPYVGHPSATLTTHTLLVLSKYLPFLSLTEEQESSLLRSLFDLLSSSCDSLLRFLAFYLFSQLKHTTNTIVLPAPIPHP